MVRRGVTINLNNYESERLDLEFPVQFLPANLTDPDKAEAFAFDWLEAKFQQRIEEIVRREAALGNRIVAPLVGGPEDLNPPARVVDSAQLDSALE